VPFFHLSIAPHVPGTLLGWPGETSRYWRRLFDAGTITDLDWANVRNVVSGQNQHFIAERYKFRSQALKEMAFEIYRAEQIPERPSRKSCLFVAEDLAMWNQLLFGPEARFAHEVELVEGAESFRADSSFLGSNTLHYEEFQNRAQRYWSGERLDGQWELLVTGQVRIVRQLTAEENPRQP
jgi:hypothetical protein